VHPTKLFLLQNRIANKLNLFRRSPGYKEGAEFQREQKEGGELVGASWLWSASMEIGAWPWRFIKGKQHTTLYKARAANGVRVDEGEGQAPGIVDESANENMSEEKR
jgi:hypothetical protein